MHPPGTQLPVDADEEAADGLTPPMERTRTTQFRPQITAPPHRVTEVEKDIYAILNVRWVSSTMHNIFHLRVY